MKIKDCNHGIIVKSKEGVLGMVIGITNNCHTADQSTREEPDRAVPLVQWQCGRTSGIHPANISKA